MNRLCTTIFALAIVFGGLVVPWAISAQAAQAEEGGRSPIGLTVVAKGAIQPIVDHTLPSQGQRSAPLSFAIELDVLYHLPIDEVALDVGIGARYLIDRAVDDGKHSYALLPLYAMIQFPFALPSLEKFWKIYLDGKVGYAFFLPSTQYRKEYLSDAEATGGLFIGFGLGTSYIFNDWFAIRLSVSYNLHNIDAMPHGIITDNVLEVSAGVGFTF